MNTGEAGRFQSLQGRNLGLRGKSGNRLNTDFALAINVPKAQRAQH